MVVAAIFASWLLRMAPGLAGSLEFSQEQVIMLTMEDAFKGWVESFIEGITRLLEENKKNKETIIDLLRDNLVVYVTWNRWMKTQMLEIKKNEFKNS